MSHDPFYPSMKPLPKPVRVELKERAPKGMVRVSTFNRQAFAASFKKAKPR